MADKTYNVIKSGQGQDITMLKKHVTLEISEISDADTITVDELTTVNAAKVIDLATGTDFTIAELATNVITIDDVTCVSDHVIVLAVGV